MMRGFTNGGNWGDLVGGAFGGVNRIAAHPPANLLVEEVRSHLGSVGTLVSSRAVSAALSAEHAGNFYVLIAETNLDSILPVDSSERMDPSAVAIRLGEAYFVGGSIVRRPTLSPCHRGLIPDTRERNRPRRRTCGPEIRLWSPCQGPKSASQLLAAAPRWMSCLCRICSVAMGITETQVRAASMTGNGPYRVPNCYLVHPGPLLGIATKTPRHTNIPTSTSAPLVWHPCSATGPSHPNRPISCLVIARNWRSLPLLTVSSPCTCLPINDISGGAYCMVCSSVRSSEVRASPSESIMPLTPSCPSSPLAVLFIQRQLPSLQSCSCCPRSSPLSFIQT